MDRPDQRRDPALSRMGPMSLAEAQRRQAAYAASRRAWAERIGYPYHDRPDPRPPPGELDAEVEE